ncbi:response regulator transcription factor [Pseudorhodoferax sp.]|uniref:response regulator transcription factor n=1 Tax=Pseudorhodoferax sp. TaxID=1993553 RepID=UPI002DD6397F|nr:response regulator transcription factor [Pseudorhodoferax sp.]
MHIAILEDDPVQRELLVLLVQQGRHSCKSFDTAAGFQAGVTGETFDMALIDWMLPDANGGEVLQWVRKTLGWQLPCIVITAREEEPVVVAALEAGADDYIVKPAKPLELLARITAASRRARPGALPVLRAGDYEIDIARQRLAMAGQPMELTQKEFDLAVCLFQNLGKLLSRDYLLDKVWGVSTEVDARTVDTHVSRLRRKLKLDGTHGWKLISVYGFGYRFERAGG